MKVYLLMYIPYGCPAHDTDVLGVYATKSAANKALKAVIDNYGDDELHIVTRSVEK